MCLLLCPPGSQLTSLTSSTVKGFNLDIGPSPSGGTDGAICALPKLQKLQLSRCSINRKYFLRFAQLTALTSLEQSSVVVTALTSLELSSVVVTGNTNNHLQLEETPLPGEERAAAFGYVLGAMHKLAHMSILVPQQQTGLRAAAFQQAGVDSMQNLQRIELSGIHCSKGMVLPLPASLTRLQLGVITGQGLVPETVPDLALGRLTNLVHLEISKVAIDGAVLAGVLQLQQLTLREVTLASRANQEKPRTALAYVVSSQTRLAKSVLRALCQLTQLQRLDLSDVPLHRVTDLPSQAELFPALAASTGLQSLQLQHEAAAPLPVGALQHMLKRRQLAKLRVLSLCNRYQLRVPYNAVPVYDGPCVQRGEPRSARSCLPGFARANPAECCYRCRCCHCFGERLSGSNQPASEWGRTWRCSSGKSGRDDWLTCTVLAGADAVEDAAPGAPPRAWGKQLKRCSTLTSTGEERALILNAAAGASFGKSFARFEGPTGFACQSDQAAVTPVGCWAKQGRKLVTRTAPDGSRTTLEGTTELVVWQLSWLLDNTDFRTLAGCLKHVEDADRICSAEQSTAKQSKAKQGGAEQSRSALEQSWAWRL